MSGISGPGTDQRAEPHVRIHPRRLEPGPGLAPPAIPGRQDRDDLRPGQRLPDRHESHMRHCRSPEQPTVAGWKWARCPGCGWQGDRDQGAWQRIAARVLTHQNKTAVSRDAGTMAVRAIDDTLEARAVVAPYASGRDRSKTGATPRRSTARRAPRRRAAPSPLRSPCGGQRPEGHATPARRLPRAVTRDQRVNATCTQPARCPHRARGAAHGAGFHQNAHATPPQRERDPSIPQTRG